MKLSGKPASIGAMVMLAGGLMVYWALSQWKLFGLGQDASAQLGTPTTPRVIGGKVIRRIGKK